MAESMSTQTKISVRFLQAMWWFSWELLYASNIQQGRLIYKDLYSKVSKTCGIKI